MRYICLKKFLTNSFSHLLLQIFIADRICKRSSSMQELVYYYPEGPYICFWPISFLNVPLGSHVERRANTKIIEILAEY